MKVLIVGGAGREHAIALAFHRSIYSPKIYCVSEMINPGIKRIVNESGGEYFRGNINDPEIIAKFAKEMDLVFIGPEEPNFHGVPDKLEELGIPCIGANRAVSEIEMSKATMRDIQWKYKIPGRLWYKKFRNYEEAIPYIEEYAESIALKPARQAGGKGVKVIEDFQVYLQDEKKKVKIQHAESIVKDYMKDYNMEYKLLIEERVWGPEYTLQCFTDGRTVLPMPAVQDNKHAFDGDLGMETGGMGSISCGRTLKYGIESDISILTEEEYWKSVEIVKMMVEAIQKETERRYHGVVAGQMMLTSIWGPTIIEMYSRLGDPEAANVLMVLKTDIVEICEAIIDERLNTIKLEFDEKAVVVKAVCPEGYPNNRNLAKGHIVKVHDDNGILWASVDLIDGKIITGGSRIVECIGIGDNIPEASLMAENLCHKVELEDGWRVFHRSDIGTEKSFKRRFELAKLAREIYQYRERRGLLGRRVIWIPGKGLMEVG
ncbi:MAG: phosphoribosylamine--glycine ligase [Candidatus Methanomethyliaceae archaeon]|nr:phosphoribosylamine--glycine ligase [Candidatus Methanomethyliaceae archaeon]MDW7971340.1 phosphoribosylamine--glycine ligase [Nitrososphaerota archaeon]